MLKSQKGITLVTLVITIIVLIILAGISITIVLGSDGIIEKAKKARFEYSNAADYEEKGIANLFTWAEDYIDNINKVEE